MEKNNQHIWTAFRNLICCTECGIVRNPKGNSPCPGKVKISTRAVLDTVKAKKAGCSGTS